MGQLVLSRYPGQRILIGSGPRQITITIVDSYPDARTTIAIDAPKDVSIDREEVRLAKLREMEQCSRNDYTSRRA